MYKLSSKHLFVPSFFKTKTGSFKRNESLKPINLDNEEARDVVSKKKGETYDEIKRSQVLETRKSAVEIERRKKELENDKKLREIVLEREKKSELIEKEIKFFTKSILISMQGCSDDEIRINAFKLLDNKDVFEKVMTVYMTNRKNDLEYYDCTNIVRQSLIRVIEEATSRIEKSHGEFLQFEKAKTMSK